MGKHKKKDRTRLKTTGEALKNKKLVRDILFLFENAPKKWLSKLDVYRMGKKKFGDNFPNGLDTVYRNLNSMTDEGILEVKKAGKGLPYQWSIKKSPYLFEELIAHDDIRRLQVTSRECVNNIKNTDSIMYNHIYVDDRISIYGFPKYIEEKHKKSLEKLVAKLNKVAKEIKQLTHTIAGDQLALFLSAIMDSDKSLLDKTLALIYIHLHIAWKIKIVAVDIDQYFNFNSEGNILGAKPNLELVNILKKTIFTSKTTEEILGLLKQHRFSKDFQTELPNIVIGTLFNLLTYTQLIFIRNGGVDGHLDPESAYQKEITDMQKRELEQYQQISYEYGVLPSLTQSGSKKYSIARIDIMDFLKACGIKPT